MFQVGKALTSFYKALLTPNSEVSSIRFVMTMILPLEVTSIIIMVFMNIHLTDQAVLILTRIFYVSAALTLGPVFIEHALDKVNSIITNVKQLKNGSSVNDLPGGIESPKE